MTKFLGNSFFECCNSPFRSQKNIRGNFLEHLSSVTSVVSGLDGGRVRPVGGGGGGPVVSSWGWPLKDRNLASETALRERERERYIYRERETEREKERERDRERQELGFCNSIARGRGERERERERERTQETGTWLL